MNSQEQYEPFTPGSTPRDAFAQVARATPSRPGFDHGRFKDIAAGVQSIVVVIGLVAAGVWSATTLAGPRKVVADAEKAQAEAELAKRELAGEAIVDCTIAVKSIVGADGHSRWVLIEVALRNVGNQPLRLELGDHMEFYVSRVEAVDSGGQVTYSSKKTDLRHLRFDYTDKKIAWLILRPKADYDRFQAVQQLDTPGLYLARFAVAPSEAGGGTGREYGAETFFTVQ